MISKNCPLSDRMKLEGVLRGICPSEFPECADDTLCFASCSIHPSLRVIIARYRAKVITAEIDQEIVEAMRAAIGIEAQLMEKRENDK